MRTCPSFIHRQKALKSLLFTLTVLVTCILIFSKNTVRSILIIIPQRLAKAEYAFCEGSVLVLREVDNDSISA